MGKATTVRVPRSRKLKTARVSCPDGTCTINKIQVRYNLRHKVFNGIGKAPSTIREGGSVIVRSTMPRRLYRWLRKRKSGTVTAIVIVRSTNGARVNNFVRTGLRR